jgi:hypothetical protein
VLIDVPVTSWLEQLVQKLDVLLRVGDTAETKNADNAIDTAWLNLAIPSSGIVNGFNTDRDDMIYIIYTKILDTFLKRFGRNGVRFHAINLGDATTCAFSVTKTLGVVGAVGIFAKTSKHICPHTTSGADLDHSTVNRGAHNFVMDNAALDATFKKGNDTLFSVGLYIWPDSGPECAEQSFAESRE